VARTQSSSFDLAPVFDELRKILVPYAPRMKVIEDKPGRYTLIAGYSEKLKKDLWFASVMTMKSYVSFHLMPIYMNDKLKATLSPALAKRMQGKACFNFKTIEPDLFKELAKVTKEGRSHFVKAGYIG
jgi:hypothetical protein